MRDGGKLDATGCLDPENLLQVAKFSHIFCHFYLLFEEMESFVKNAA